ncbi:tetratricopeptide repeat protein [Pontiella agarivorans]|uniref:Tetratricopeptide repeat protein n=1 Tax=Pontiella agarivorans TaxID=3038953 RepID=A0ABU5MU69_9BACT|nr:tetratricopeptide repeat protein [Pontiella agarivorans]MDZ8117688.1 tetratricopeptide repeat protein [Pontiella agarivorans]
MRLTQTLLFFLLLYAPLVGSAGQPSVLADELTGILNTIPSDSIRVDYPGNHSVFPPDIVAPTFIWHDQTPTTNWMIFVKGTDGNVYRFRSDGAQQPPKIDPDAISEANAHYRPSAYAQSARHWTPDEAAWENIKKTSLGKEVDIYISGIPDAPNADPTSLGHVRISISTVPVGAPIFYRDVPLMPSKNNSGKISPLSKDLMHVMKWRLRDISKPEAPVVLQDMPTCANCHSFSTDGKTLGMDMDGPNGDKGAYGIVPVEKNVVIENQDIISWNTYEDTPDGHMNFGLFSQISPDGRYVVSTLNEDTFVVNYPNFGFLQSFYPTRGILVVYDRETGRMFPLPGADDPRFVQTNAVWSLDGTELVFSRAPAQDAFASLKIPAFAGDDGEPDIQYDLYRIPFNKGKGGKALPVEGASNNGKSNSFAKFSPNGKWIVYVQAARGQLMRPDSKLYIIPANGGIAREMNCNLTPMNSWHSWSPNSRWLVFSSKGMGPFTKMFLTHIDENGVDTPAILIPDSTAANRAVNIPEFVNGEVDAIEKISAPSQESYKLYKQSKLFADQDQLDRALETINQSLALNPYYAKGHYRKGTILLQMNQTDEALSCFIAANKYDPEMAEAYDFVIYYYMQNEGIDKAIDYMTDLLNRIPVNPLAEKTLADLYLRRGDHSLAIQHYINAAQSKRYPADFYGHIGSSLLKLGAYEEARIRFERALEIDPDNADVIYNLGIYYQKTGYFEKATALFRQAVELDSNSGAHYDLGVLAMNENHLDAAAFHFKKFLQKRPKVTVARTKLASIYYMQGKQHESAVQYEMILDEDPENISALLLLSKIYATSANPQIAHPERAITLSKRGCELTVYKQPVYLDSLAVAYASAGRYSDAVTMSEKALQHISGTNNPSLLHHVQNNISLFKSRLEQ